MHAVEEPESFAMTPMIDIVFQLLIFFVLVTDLAHAQLADVTLPPASKAQPARGEDPLVVNVLPDGSYQIGGRKWTAANLEQTLAALPEHRGIRVRADRSSPFESVLRILSMTAGMNREIELGARREP